MSSYVTLTLNTNMYREIIDCLMESCSKLDNFFDMQGAVHLIDYLQEEYDEDMARQNNEFQQLVEYEKLFNEYFKDGIDEKGINEYKNFNKINKVLDEYKEAGTLDILDTKQQFFLVLDLIKAMEEKQ